MTVSNRGSDPQFVPKAREFFSPEVISKLELSGEHEAANFAKAVSKLHQSHDKRGLSLAQRIFKGSKYIIFPLC